MLLGEGKWAGFLITSSGHVSRGFQITVRLHLHAYEVTIPSVRNDKPQMREMRKHNCGKDALVPGSSRLWRYARFYCSELLNEVGQAKLKARVSSHAPKAK